MLAETPPLPIESVLAEIARAFQQSRAVVLAAPPGAGKSTRVPLWMLTAGFVGNGRLLLLEPRRMAARAVAERMASLLGERTGQTVGYQIRFEARMSDATRILVITEGILSRRMISDPFLEGVSAVVLDEFHERSVHSDLALAFVKELTSVRDDLRLLVMSATMETDRVSRFLGGCPVVQSEGRTYPLTVTHVSRVDERPLENRTAAAVAEALKTAPNDGDILVFLPGEGEIRRVRRRLEEMRLRGDPELVPLYGALSAAEQDRALKPADRRRVVLATNIAETSLTIPNITGVVDSGLRRTVRFDPAAGLDRLETGFISQSSADQRAGRAGRVAEGQVIRLWTAHEHKGRPQYDTPEILRIDTAPVLLQLAAFHPGDPRRADLLDNPEDAQWQVGIELLHRLGAIDRGSFRLTDMGKKLAALPVHPRLGAILLRAAAKGAVDLGATVAALAAERDISDRSVFRETDPALITDFDHRLALFQEYEREGGGERAAAKLGLYPAAARSALKAKQSLAVLVRAEPRTAVCAAKVSCGELLCAGFPDRVAKLRSDSLQEVRMVGGRGLSFPAPMRDAEGLFVVLDADAGPQRASASGRIHSACEIGMQDLVAAQPDLFSRRVRAMYNPKTETVAAWEETLFGDLVICEKPVQTVDPQSLANALADAAAQRFPNVFSPDPAAVQLIFRIRFATRIFPQKPLPDVSEAGLIALLPEICMGQKTLEAVRRTNWQQTILNRLDYGTKIWLDKEIPERMAVPSGSQISVNYDTADKTDGAPHIACRIQELFGLLETPRIAEGRVPLLLHLLAPNMRPCQVTKDLSSFWQTTYKEVRKDLKGRYPKHYWPEDPFTATATAKVRPKPEGGGSK